MTRNIDNEVLDTLIATTQDSVEGYQQSARQIDDPQISAFFTERASERSQIVGSLQERQRELGGEIRDKGSVLGSAHRSFLDLKDKVTGSDREAIVNEVKTGESYLSEKFQAALGRDDLSPQTRELLQQTYRDIERGHQQVETLSQIESQAG